MGLGNKIKWAFLSLSLATIAFFTSDIFKYKKWEDYEAVKILSEDPKYHVVHKVRLKKRQNFFVLDGHSREKIFPTKSVVHNNLDEKLLKLYFDVQQKNKSDKKHFYIYDSKEDSSFLVEGEPSIDNLVKFYRDNFVFFEKDNSFYRINCKTGEINSAISEFQFKLFTHLGFLFVPFSVFSLFYLANLRKKKETFLSPSAGKPLESGILAATLSSVYFLILRNFAAVDPSAAANASLLFNSGNAVLSGLYSIMLNNLEKPTFKNFFRLFLTPFLFAFKSEKLDKHLDSVYKKDVGYFGAKAFAASTKKDYAALLDYWHKAFSAELSPFLFDKLALKILTKLYPVRTILPKSSVKKDSVYLTTGQAYLRLKEFDNAFKYFSRINTLDKLILALEISAVAGAHFSQKIFEKYICSAKPFFRSFGHHTVFEIKYEEGSLANFANVIKKGSKKELESEFKMLKELEVILKDENVSGVSPLIPIIVGEYDGTFYLVERRIHGKLLNQTGDSSGYDIAAQILALSHAKSSLTGVKKDYENYAKRFSSKFPDISYFSKMLDSLYRQRFVFDEDGHDLNFIVGKSKEKTTLVTKIDRASRPDVGYGVDLGRLFMRNIDARSDSVAAYSDLLKSFDFSAENVDRDSAFGQVFAALSYAFYEVERNKEKTQILLDNASLVVEDYDKRLSRELRVASRNL